MTVRTKADKAAIARLRTFLDTRAAGFRGDAQLRAILSDRTVRRYLETWVLPLLDELDPPPAKENSDQRAADIIIGRTPAPLAALRHHVTGAIERGEATAVTEEEINARTDDEGMSGYDACAAISGAIVQARALLETQS